MFNVQFCLVQYFHSVHLFMWFMDHLADLLTVLLF